MARLQMLNEVVAALGVSRESLFLLIVTGLGSLGTILAALAARGAARATQASVEELKEARLQAVRPALIAGLGQERELTFFWSRGCDPRFELGNLFALPTETHLPLLLLTNVGAGAAINIQLDWRRGDRKLLDQTSFETVVHFFERGRFAVERTDWGLKISDPNRVGYYSKAAGWGGGAHSHHRFEICPANERVELELIHDSLFTLLVEIIADQGEFGSGLQTRTDELCVTYSSISGERFSQNYELRYSGSYVQTIMDGRGSFGDEEWNLIEAHLNLAITRHEPKAISWRYILGTSNRKATRGPAIKGN